MIMTEEEEAQLTMFMRVIEFFRKHEHVLKDKPDIVAAADDLKSKVQEIFNLLSEEDKDKILEKYKEDLIYLNNQK